MFGMGLFEILLIAIVAIIALGPEKLPTAMIEVARFFKKFKSGLDEAKSTLDNELQLSDMKEEASKFKAQIESVKSTIKVDDLNLDVNSILNEDTKTPKKAFSTLEETPEIEVITKKEDKFKISVDETSKKEEKKDDTIKKENNNV